MNPWIMDGGGSRRRLPGRQAQGRKERDLPGSCRQEERRDCGREGGKLGGGGGARRPGTGRGVPAPPPFLPLSPNLNLVNLTSQFLFLLFLFSFASSLSLSLRRLVTTAFFFFYLKAKNKRALLFLLFIPWNIHQAPNPECSMTAPFMPLHVQTLYGLQT